MNKYELALVVSAKIEDEAREAVVERVKGLIARFGGTVTDVEKDLPMRFRRCARDSITSSSSSLMLLAQAK